MTSTFNLRELETDVACRDAVKKAVELLKAASSTAGTPSSNAELLISLSSLEEQLQAVLPETLPAVLEGTHSGIMQSEYLLLKLRFVSHAHRALHHYVHVINLAMGACFYTSTEKLKSFCYDTMSARHGTPISQLISLGHNANVLVGLLK